MLVDVEPGQFLATASPAGIPVVVLVVGGLVLLVIIAVLLTRRGKGPRA